MTMQYTIYFAGPLFDHKILQGNALLASHIENVSQGRYRCVLPQNLEQRGVSSLEIRDQNLRALMQCDLALFNFDGSDLDSGTVAEYMYAKTLDIPSVILRTDFRYGGDQEPEGNPWNLMVSFYPRTFALHLDAMQRYTDAFSEGGSAQEVSARIQQLIATEVVDMLDTVRADTPILQGGKAAIANIYSWALQLAGGSLADLASDERFVRRVVERKIEMGLLSED